MAQPMESPVKRPRVSFDLEPEVRHRLRIAAAMRVLTIRQYVLKAIEQRLHEDLGRGTEGMLALTAKGDRVLAEVWDNRRDAEYDRLYSAMIRADQVT